MDPTTQYWQERLEQEQFDHEVEVERLKKRIVELEEQLEVAKQKLHEADSGWQRD